MAVDVYWADNQASGVVCSVSHSALESIAAALEQLEQKTGVLIDPYTTQVLSPEHALVLTEALGDRPVGGSAKPFVTALCDASCARRALLLEGD